MSGTHTCVSHTPDQHVQISMSPQVVGVCLCSYQGPSPSCPALPCPLLVTGPHCSPCPGAPHPPSGRRQLRSQDPVPDITVMSLTPGPSDVPPGALGPRPPTSCRQAAPQPSQGACRRRTQTGTGRCTPCWRRHPRSAWAGTGRGEGQWGGRGDGVRVKRQGPEGL